MYRVTLGLLVCVFGGCASSPDSNEVTSQPALESRAPASQPAGEKRMSLGNFSVSLNVKDVAASREFYLKLGFKDFSPPSKRMAIMQNDTCTIGLFQGFFEKNILTFNPGWDRNCKTPPDFDDVRDIQKKLKSLGLVPVVAADESTSGPASMILTDPDGNQILLDQHVPKPKK